MQQLEGFERIAQYNFYGNVNFGSISIDNSFTQKIEVIQNYDPQLAEVLQQAQETTELKEMVLELAEQLKEFCEKPVKNESTVKKLIDKAIYLKAMYDAADGGVKLTIKAISYSLQNFFTGNTIQWPDEANIC